LAPAYNSVCASSASFFIAAQCSAVMPSPCAALTSAACLSSAFTASRSPSCAASATVAGDAADSSADNDSAAPIAIREPVFISLLAIPTNPYEPLIPNPQSPITTQQ